MKTVENVKEVIKAVENGAVAVYQDKFWDEFLPDYIIFETEAEACRFEELLAQADESIHDLHALQSFIDSRFGSVSNLTPVYRKGGWVEDPQGMIESERAFLEAVADVNWHDAQRAHFAETDPYWEE